MALCVQVTITLHPHYSGPYRFDLICYSGSSASGGTALSALPLASSAVAAVAAFPALAVTDVQCSGMAKQVAWQMLGLPAINAELAASVSTAEMKVRAQPFCNMQYSFDL